MSAKFVQTDQVSEITDEQRDLGAVHEGHKPVDHICDGCSDLHVGTCWQLRHDLPPSEEDESVRRMGERRPGECICLCHHLVDQCLLSQAAAKDAGRPLYRLEDNIDGWSIVMPQSVYEHFQTIPEQIRQQAMDKMIEHARSQAPSNDAPEKTPDAH